MLHSIPHSHCDCSSKPQSTIFAGFGINDDDSGSGGGGDAKDEDDDGGRSCQRRRRRRRGSCNEGKMGGSITPATLSKLVVLPSLPLLQRIGILRVWLRNFDKTIF